MDSGKLVDWRDQSSHHWDKSALVTFTIAGWRSKSHQPVAQNSLSNMSWVTHPKTTLLCHIMDMVIFMQWPSNEDRQPTADHAVIPFMQPNAAGLGQITAGRPGLTEIQQWQKAQHSGCHHRVSQLTLSLPHEFGKICRMLLSNNVWLDSGGSHFPIRSGDSQKKTRCAIIWREAITDDFPSAFLSLQQLKKTHLNLGASFDLWITSHGLLYEMTRPLVLLGTCSVIVLLSLPLWYLGPSVISVCFLFLYPKSLGYSAPEWWVMVMPLLGWNNCLQIWQNKIES